MDMSRSDEGKFWVTFTRLQPAAILFPPSLRGWHFSEVSHLQPGKESRDTLGSRPPQSSPGGLPAVSGQHSQGILQPGPSHGATCVCFLTRQAD